jgi:O-antigen ligase
MKIFTYFLYTLTSFVPFILSYGALDKVYPEVLYLSVCQFLISIYLLIYDKKYKQITQELFKSNGIIILFTFIIWSAVTILSSFNKVEALTEWFRFYLFFVSIFNVAIIYKIIDDKRIFFITVISILFIESFYVFNEFLSVYNFNNPPERNYSFVGFTSNLNVNAYNLLLKTVLIYYIYFISQRKWQKLILVILIAISTFNIFIISSRSAILVLIGIQLILIAFSTLAFLRNTFNKNQLKKAITILSISIFVFFSQSFLYQNSKDFSVENRITTYDFQDSKSSANFRLNFYKEAIQGLFDKPFLGYGIGNWKIFSIKYASHRIREYQVPYHAHNDFLHMFAETGIIGGILYFLIYFFPIYYLFSI